MWIFFCLLYTLSVVKVYSRLRTRRRSGIEYLKKKSVGQRPWINAVHPNIEAAKG